MVCKGAVATGHTVSRSSNMVRCTMDASFQTGGEALTKRDGSSATLQNIAILDFGETCELVADMK